MHQDLPEMSDEALHENLQSIRKVAEDNTHPGHKPIEGEGEIDSGEVAEMERQEDQSVSLPCPHEDCSYSTI